MWGFSIDRRLSTVDVGCERLRAAALRYAKKRGLRLREHHGLGYWRWVHAAEEHAAREGGEQDAQAWRRAKQRALGRCSVDLYWPPDDARFDLYVGRSE